MDQDVVFAAGEYRPGDLGGRALIAHELAHTVQQARGGPAPAGTDRTERAAAAASAAGARGTAPAPVLEGSAVGVARVAAGEQTQERTAPEKPDSLGFWGDLLVDELAGVAVGSGLQQQMLKAAVIGFFAELDRQIQDPKSRADIHAGAMDLAKSGNQEKMIAAYYAGAAAGLVSPLTDLLGIGVLLEQLQAFGGKLATGVLKGEIDLIDEVTGLVGAYEDFKYHLAASLIETIKEHPEDLFFFGGLRGRGGAQGGRGRPHRSPARGRGDLREGRGQAGRARDGEADPDAAHRGREGRCGQRRHLQGDPGAAGHLPHAPGAPGVRRGGRRSAPPSATCSSPCSRRASATPSPGSRARSGASARSSPGVRRPSPRSARPSRPWRTRSAPSSKGRSAR
ncbi:hypothetical protein GCM10020254_70410 [Streptomyces goshikiensis]